MPGSGHLLTVARMSRAHRIEIALCIKSGHHPTDCGQLVVSLGPLPRGGGAGDMLSNYKCPAKRDNFLHNILTFSAYKMIIIIQSYV